MERINTYRIINLAHDLDQSGSIIGFFLIGMLAGCSEHPTHSSDTDLPAATAEQNSPQDIVTTRKVDLSFLSKPKRPIQTPWGSL